MKKILKEVFNIENITSIGQDHESYIIHTRSIDPKVKLKWNRYSHSSSPHYVLDKDTLHVRLESWLFENNHINEIKYSNKKWIIKLNNGTKEKGKNLTKLMKKVINKIIKDNQ